MTTTNFPATTTTKKCAVSPLILCKLVAGLENLENSDYAAEPPVQMVVEGFVD
ncbi:hypothetical protein MTR_3g087910 [Medicago truncatula]|uniref:Uncharacterized protein n=1 Tax=Medicago truncatula TaxID=3880 RepID=G7J4E7_MEDTR|nr:hypothetical protein MTR_3g087910 [Medicago truncatula]